MQSMSSSLKPSKTVEVTLNLKKLAKKVSWKHKSSMCIKTIRRHVKRQFKSDNDVMISPDVNKFVWSYGKRNIPTRMRVRIESIPSPKDATKNVFRVALVKVNTFKGLLNEVIVD